MPCPYCQVKYARLKCGRRCKFQGNESARLTSWRVRAQPFDPAPRDLRMNCAAAQFTSSAPTEYWSPWQHFARADTACRPDQFNCGGPTRPLSTAAGRRYVSLGASDWDWGMGLPL
jgi:hypothetical protein